MVAVETSFDIYPVGWDKSYVLSRFNDENVWFVGDRCEGLGNDVEIYNALQPHGRAFKVMSPDETPSKVREIMAGIGAHSDEFFSPPY